MSETGFQMDEFIDEEESTVAESTEGQGEDTEQGNDLDGSGELDVQKAVVESLAADKVKLEREIADITAENEKLKSKIEELEKSLEAEKTKLEAEKNARKEDRIEFEKSKEELEGQVEELCNRELDIQARKPNALALLDREPELPDRFPGETRDQVLEVIKEGLKIAEEKGRIRRVQILESVLVANEPNGTLAKKRAELEQLFAKNGHIVSGEVIEELKNRGISHKNGEEFLMPEEIINRNF